MNAKEYFKLHITKYLLKREEEREVMYQLMEDYCNHVIKEHNEWQSISEDELNFNCDDDDCKHCEDELCDSNNYCACGEEIESENSAVCIDCFNEMTFND